ncbi:MAG: hypothetical protein HQL35_01710 [Alphaproteobacteria bacterium]|nr:hypothetical protein [Alphaproteobacteria bacterium]
MKRIFFLIDEVSRDAVVAASLKAILAKRGVDLVYGNRPRAGLFKRAMPFDAIILPSLVVLESLFPDPDADLPPLIVLPGEGIGGIPENPQRAALKFLGFRFMKGDDRWARKVSAYCLWGRQQRRGFEEFSPHLLDHCHVIGHPRYDKRCSKNARQLEPGDGRIRLGFLTRFSLINPFDRRSNLVSIHDSRRSVYHHLQQEGCDLDAEDLWFTNVQDLRIFLDILENIDQDKFDAVVRVHPREDRTRWEEIIAEKNIGVRLAEWDEPLLHWQQKVDHLIAPPSTSFYDAFACGKSALCLGGLNPRRREHILPLSDDTSKILDYVPHPASLEELFDKVSVKPSSTPSPMPEEVRELLAKDADFPECHRSLDRLADVCMNVLERPGRYRYGAGQKFVYDLLEKRQDFQMRGTVDQGSWFRLDKNRIEWIDNLANPEAGLNE